MARCEHSDGSISQRSNARWVARITREGSKRTTFYGKTRKEVQQRLYVALSEYQQGLFATGSQQNVEPGFTHWLEHAHQQNVRGRTYERYTHMRRLHLVPALGSHPFKKLSAHHLQSFSPSKREEGLSATTVIRFHHGLETAVRRKLMAQPSCDLVLPPRRKPVAIQPLSLQQAYHLLQAAPGHRLETLFVLAFAPGMRRGEVLGLTWQAINLQTGQRQERRLLTRVPSRLPRKGLTQAKPKTEKKERRSIALAPFVREALNHHRIWRHNAKGVQPGKNTIAFFVPQKRLSRDHLLSLRGANEALLPDVCRQTVSQRICLPHVSTIRGRGVWHVHPDSLKTGLEEREHHCI